MMATERGAKIVRGSIAVCSGVIVWGLDMGLLRDMS